MLQIGCQNTTDLIRLSVKIASLSFKVVNRASHNHLLINKSYVLTHEHENVHNIDPLRISAIEYGFMDTNGPRSTNAKPIKLCYFGQLTHETGLPCPYHLPRVPQVMGSTHSHHGHMHCLIYYYTHCSLHRIHPLNVSGLICCLYQAAKLAVAYLLVAVDCCWWHWNMCNHMLNKILVHLQMIFLLGCLFAINIYM